ncbi:ribonuclease HI family protein [Liquorilactobacillus oeni]|uniref:Ribonuclease H n=1 Tax=Liquorilactobacillus oeni DSM 19972 TaxID=1423777 RepID=A0A0R1MH35_9LACO|nr:ribonuclease HI family protein [Liquorilactobacillus oeni]KRL04613.1 ribonuclease H [Liquorilactobacillus oeni DSM 19972]
MIKLYTDAATKGNPGPSSAGVLIISQGKQQQFSFALSPSSNHEAEFNAAIMGWKKVAELFGTKETILFFSDSKIVMDSIAKKYSKSYPHLLKKLLKLQKNYSLVINRWIPEKENHGAHTLALQKLHQL